MKNEQNAVTFKLPEHKEKIRVLLNQIGYDGHTIWKPTVLVSAGLKEFLPRFVKNYQSDGSPKGNIYKDGQVITDLMGVYGLDVIESIASDLGIPDSGMMGRGFRAQKQTRAILEFLAAN